MGLVGWCLPWHPCESKQSDKLGWLQGPSEVARKREQARSSQWRRRPGESREGSRFGCLIGSVWPGRPSPQPLASCHLSPIDTSPFLSKPPNPARQAHFPCDDGSWVDGETSQLWNAGLSVQLQVYSRPMSDLQARCQTTSLWSVSFKTGIWPQISGTCRERERYVRWHLQLPHDSPQMEQQQLFSFHCIG